MEDIHRSSPDSFINRDSKESFCLGLKDRFARKVRDNKKIFAESAMKSDGPFYCPMCFSDVIVRKDKGSGKQDHFAHIARMSDLIGKGESELHKKCKEEICNSLSLQFPDGQWKVERLIEKNERTNFPGLVPDISGRIIRQLPDGTQERIPVVIEIQRSYLQIPTIFKRTTAYTSRNPKVYILWIIPLKEKLKQEAFRPRLFERYLHSMYFGRVYYWWPGLGSRVTPVHFGRTKRHIEAFTWLEDGQERSVGGYDKNYKTLKLPELLDPIEIGNDFITKYGVEFNPYKFDKNRKHTLIPGRNIFLDKNPVWWEQESVYVNDEDKQLEEFQNRHNYIDDYIDLSDCNYEFPD